jgi:hypothetical protein
MSEWKEYTTLIGLMALALLVVFLFYPGSLFTSVSFIDADLSEALTRKISVRTKINLALEDQLKYLPFQINGWVGSDQSNPQELGQRLDTYILLMRAYRKADQQPVFLLILQSPNKLSFHPPPICYQFMGYRIEETGNENVYVSDSTWAALPVSREHFSKLEWQDEAIKLTPYAGLVSVKKLVVSKTDNGDIKDRRLVLYFYIKDKYFATNQISMVRLSTLIPPQGSYDIENNMVRQFMGEIIPLMFKPAEERQMLITKLTASGAAGYFLIIILAKLQKGRKGIASKLKYRQT